MTAKKVLIVDDDADYVRINRKVLEKAGYKVYDAYNSAEGEKLCHEIHPDLIILDVMMGTITDGFFTTYNLRKEKDTAQIPILMVSSVNDTVPYRFEPDEQYLPVDRFLDKPVDAAKLLETVGEMLEMSEKV